MGKNKKGEKRAEAKKPEEKRPIKKTTNALYDASLSDSERILCAAGDLVKALRCQARKTARQNIKLANSSIDDQERSMQPPSDVDPHLSFIAERAFSKQKLQEILEKYGGIAEIEATV